jgi:O-antigen/teichoic acid export membrane protein
MDKLKNAGRESLIWLGNYFETDILYVAKSGFWLTFGQIVSTGLVLIMSVFFANFVSKEVYGEYKFIISLASILGSFSLSGMGTIVVQSVAKGLEGTLKKAVSLSLKWGILTFLAGLSISAYYFINGNNILGISMLIASMAVPLNNAYSIYGTYFSGRKDFKSSTIYWLITQVLVNLGLILTAITTKSSLYLVLTYFFISALSSIWCYYYVLARYKPNDKYDNSIISYGKHLSVMGFFGTLANQLDKILVFHFLGPVNLAIYSFSQAIPEQIKGSYKNLFAIALPKYSETEEKDLRKSIMKKIKQLTLISAGIVLLYIFISPYIFALLFPKYIESVIYSQIYILGLVTIPGISLFSIYFQIKKDTGTMYKLTTVSNTVTTLLTIILVYKYGLKGAVIENGLSWFIMLLINYYYFYTHRETSTSS